MIRGSVARLYRRLAFAVPSAVDPRVVTAFCEHHRDRSTVAGYLDAARRLIGELREPFELDRISCRVLIVWGDRDRLVFHRGADRILEAVPGARLELLHGVGHCPQVEVPERFTELLLEFTSEPDAQAA